MLRRVLLVVSLSLLGATTWSSAAPTATPAVSDQVARPQTAASGTICSPNPVLCIQVPMQSKVADSLNGQDPCEARGLPKCVSTVPSGPVPFRVEPNGTITCGLTPGSRGNEGGGSGAGGVGAYAGAETGDPVSGNQIETSPDAPCGRYDG